MFWIWVAGLAVASVVIGWAVGLNAGAEAHGGGHGHGGHDDHGHGHH